MYSFSSLEPVCCSMSDFNCCFLTCMQISQGAGQVVWYSHLFPNFPHFPVIHAVKAFGIVNKAACVLSHFSRVLLSVTLQTMAHQAPLSIGFSRQEYWYGLPFPSPVMYEVSEVKSFSHVQLFETPMDCCLPGSSAHGIFQSRGLEWGAISFCTVKKI